LTFFNVKNPPPQEKSRCSLHGDILLILSFVIGIRTNIFSVHKSVIVSIISALNFYRALHRFGQAKFPDGGLVLGSSQLSVLPPQNDA